MTSARSFSHALIECGKGAVMSKFDMCDAYKLMPAKVSDYRLQGFCWLNRFFVELAQIFGAETAVCNFDALGHTLHVISMCATGILPRLVFRQLDDLPIVAPRWTTWCQDLTKVYSDNCALVNVKLAENCPSLDKAFVNSTKGKVLGIWFDSDTLTWSYPSVKRDKLLILIYDVFHSVSADLEDLESLVGRLNDFSLMCPFMRTFKKNCILLLTEVLAFPHQDILVNSDVKADLKVWWALLSDEVSSLPICPRYRELPLSKKVFTSDAAGMPSSAPPVKKVGVGIVGLDESGCIMLAFQWFWADHTLSSCYDNKHVMLGDKTTTLELVGVLLPLLLCPDRLTNQHVVLQVDNMGAVWGWEKGYVAGDNMASILIRCIVVLSARLGSVIHVTHLPRVSDWEARVADRLSRSKTTTPMDRCLLSHYNLSIPECFLSWLSHPSEDWSLPLTLVSHVDRMLTS
jgi:hypothetical protein